MSWSIRQPGYLNEPLKGVRGVAGGLGLTMAGPRFAEIAGSVLDFAGEKLKPGEEVAVIVPLPGLPLRADIKKLTATIEVQKDDAAEKASLKQESVIEEAGGPQKTFKVDIAMPDVPRNLAVRLDGGEVFWSFADVAVRGTYTLPDFVEHANTYLDKLPAETEEVRFRFLVKSDGPGEVKITLADAEYSVIQTQSWLNPLDNTVRLDRTFQLDFGSVERIPLDAFADQGGQKLVLSVVRADLGGEFGPERLFGSLATHSGKVFATVSADYSLAQSFKFGKALSEKAIRCAGVTGLLRAESEAELYVEIQNDVGGLPSSESPLAKANLTLAPAGTPQNGPWVFVGFAAPVALDPETPYWIIAKGIRGKALLGLQPQPGEYLQHVLVSRGGRLWKSLGRASAPPAAALLRLVYLPEFDNQTAATEVGIEGVPTARRFEPGPRAQTLLFEVPQGLGTQQTVLVLKSHARGTVSVANVIQEYTPTGAEALFKLRAVEAPQESMR